MSLQSTLEAELRAVGEALPDNLSPENAQLVLEQVGDGLRANAVVPRAVSQWTQGLETHTLEQVLGLGESAVNELVLPGNAAEEALLAVAALERDRMESLIVAVRHACFSSGRVPRSLPAFARLEQEVSLLDQALAERVSRQAVERCLGERRALLTTTSWCDVLPEEEQPAQSSVGAKLEAALSSLGRPSDGSVTRYIEGGKGARWIERFASEDDEFAQELEACIGMLRTAGETVSLAARRWQQRPTGDLSPDAIELRLPLRLSASSESDRSPIVRQQLGLLYPTAAEAMLEMRSDRALLHVYAEPGSLRRVRFGEESREVPSDAEEVVLEASLAAGPWRLSVESMEGARFAITLAIRGLEQE